MINIVLSIAAFAVLKWMFLKLFTTPQRREILESETQAWQSKSRVLPTQEIDKRRASFGEESGFVHGR
jgi:hypothetical protein